MYIFAFTLHVHLRETLKPIKLWQNKQNNVLSYACLLTVSDRSAIGSNVHPCKLFGCGQLNSYSNSDFMLRPTNGPSLLNCQAYMNFFPVHRREISNNRANYPSFEET